LIPIHIVGDIVDHLQIDFLASINRGPSPLPFESGPVNN
jgi:hypothetical protein